MLPSNRPDTRSIESSNESLSPPPSLEGEKVGGLVCEKIGGLVPSPSPPVLSRSLETLDTRVEGGDVALRGYKFLFLLVGGLQQPLKVCFVIFNARLKSMYPSRCATHNKMPKATNRQRRRHLSSPNKVQVQRPLHPYILISACSCRARLLSTRLKKGAAPP